MKINSKRSMEIWMRRSKRREIEIMENKKWKLGKGKKEKA